MLESNPFKSKADEAIPFTVLVMLVPLSDKALVFTNGADAPVIPLTVVVKLLPDEVLLTVPTA